MQQHNNILRTGVIQFNANPGQVESNLSRMSIYLAEAGKSDCNLVVLPELFNVGYDLQLLPRLDYDFNKVIENISEAAVNHNFHICAGILEKQQDQLYNSLVVIDNRGYLVSTYRKISLFPLSIESEVFEAGTEPVVIEIGGVKIGLMICFDIRFPELFRKYVESGCEAIVVASAFPFPRLDHWRTLLKSAAITNQVYVIAANRCGFDSDFWFCGNSCIIDPWGTVNATADESEEGPVFFDVNLEYVAQNRSKMPCLDHAQKLRKLFF